MKRAGMIAACAALVITGVAAIVAVNVATRNAARSNEWTQTLGTLERVHGERVAYRYAADGSTHRGEAPARPRANYTAGGPVLVYVNPANPAESLLDLPPRPATWPTTAGTVALLVGAGLGIWAWQQGRPKVAPAAPAPRKGTKVPGDTTTRRKAPPLARLQPPAGAKWKRGEDKPPIPS